MSSYICSSAIVDINLQCPTGCSFNTLSGALASGASIIHVKPGIYNESISISNVTLEADSGVFINNITVLNVTINGGTYNNLTTLGNVVITNATVSLVNNGILEITKSKILSLTNNNCASIYNNYIFAPIVSTGGTVNIAENVFCSVSNLLSASNTTARVLSNTIISNLPDFVAYVADDTSIVQSANNTFRVGATPTISASTNVRTNDDAWIGDFPINNNPLNAYNVNGDNIINAQYGNVVNTDTAYATTVDDYVINVTAPGGDITLSPTNEGQVIFIRNNSGSTIDINGTPLANDEGAIYTYVNGNWIYVSGTGGIAPPPVPPFFVNNSVFVDSVFGNNATAQPNNPALSATTIEYAVSIAPSSTAMIYVQPGTYAPLTGFTTNNFYFSPDAIVTWAAAGTLFGGTSNVYGHGTFNLTGTGTLFGTSGVVEGEVVTQDIASTGTIFDVANSVVKFNTVNPANTSIFSQSAVDIQEVNIPDIAINFFVIANSSLRIKSIGGPFTGGISVPIFVSIGTSFLQVDNALLAGTPRTFFQSADTATNTDIRIGIISSIGTLLQGTGNITGYVGSIESNTVDPIISSPNLIVNMRIGSLVSTNVAGFSITNSNLIIDRLIVSGVASTAWDLPDSFLQVGYLSLSGITGTAGLFIISATSTMKIKYLTSAGVSGFLTVNGTLDLVVDRIVATTAPATYITINGVLNAKINRTTTTAVAVIPLITNNSVSPIASVISIESHTGGSLVIGTGTSATYRIGSIFAANVALVYFTFSGANRMTLNVGHMVFNTQSTLITSSAPVDLTFSGSGSNTAVVATISDIVQNNIKVTNLTLTGVGGGNIINISTDIGIAQTQQINMNNVALQSNVLVTYSGPAIIKLNINNIETGNTIIDQTAVGQDYTINIDNIVTNGAISNITYFSDNTRYRLHVATGKFNVGGIITIGGNTHVEGANSGIWLNFGNITTAGIDIIQINAEAAVYIDAKMFRGTSGSLIRLADVYGTYVRITGKYATLESPVYLTYTTVNADLTILGVYFCHVELISVNQAGFRAEFGVSAGVTLTYRTRIFTSVSRTPPVIVTVVAGTVNPTFPIQAFTTYPLLPN